jgi:hypothetical protein
MRETRERLLSSLQMSNGGAVADEFRAAASMTANYRVRFGSEVSRDRDFWKAEESLRVARDKRSLYQRPSAAVRVGARRVNRYNKRIYSGQMTRHKRCAVRGQMTCKVWLMSYVEEGLQSVVSQQSSASSRQSAVASGQNAATLIVPASGRRWRIGGCHDAVISVT